MAGFYTPGALLRVLSRTLLAPSAEAQRDQPTRQQQRRRRLNWNNRPPIGPVLDEWEDIDRQGMYWCDLSDLVQNRVDGAPNHGGSG
jgi:hypothetical protein